MSVNDKNVLKEILLLRAQLFVWTNSLWANACRLTRTSDFRQRHHKPAQDIKDTTHSIKTTGSNYLKSLNTLKFCHTSETEYFCATDNK